MSAAQRITPLALLLACGPGCAPDQPALAVAPDTGSRSGGLDVAIAGAQLDDEGEPITLTGHGPLALYFGNRAAAGVVIEGDFLLHAVTPKREEAGVVDVQLHFSDGLVVVIEDGFEYSQSTGLVLTPDITR